ncbi:wax ester synthase-like Acyl-CoA acyltransferase domain protein [Mycobacterium ulcerans str. Harvey]|uniref:diacylglycerol O-acyltransferase n=1 Tax=Mycobacterium ulcerans str. Harvey TaxID=1299332 RepID=A0ABN0QX62_MYCUL|nr:wax ester synthase-like Acyl-CoA acyltransferase domain protein [Mycobacterium ulcerans str. Harvey]
MHIGAFAIFDMPKNAPRGFIRDLYEAVSQLAFLPFPFDSVIVGGPSMAYWKQVQPDPSSHVRVSALPQPGTARDLGALVERLHSTPLDMTKPLWELHVIEGLEGKQFAIYFKAHHCAVDGMGGVNLIKSWLTTDPTAPRVRASRNRSAMITIWPPCSPPPRPSVRSRAFRRSAS